MVKRYLFYLFNSIGVSCILRWQKRNTLTVLSLHRVSDEKDYFWSPINPITFEKLLKYIIKHYQVISFGDIPFLNKNTSKRFLILSFDDGYYDFYEYALPLLKKYNLPCNHNIVNECATNNQIIWTQRLNIIFNYCKNNNWNLCFEIQNNKFTLRTFHGNWMQFYLKIFKTLLKIPKTERLLILSAKEKEFSIVPVSKMMNWQQILGCSKNRVEIGCHTYTHDVLSTITDLSILQKEIVQSAIEIEKKIENKVRVIALPNGEGNNKIKDVIKASGIKNILFVDDKINKLSSVNSSEIRNIYRINIVQESLAEMIFRIELFHTKIKKYGGILYPKNWVRKF